MQQDPSWSSQAWGSGGENDSPPAPQPAQQAAPQPTTGQPAASQPQHQPAPQAQAAQQPAQHYGAPASCPPQPVFAAPQPAYAPAPQPAKKRGWIVALVAVVLAFLLIGGAMASCASVFSTAGSLAAVSSSGVYGDTIAVIDIDGTIQYDGSACSPEGLKTLLDQASDDPDIKGLVLRVNSGGGTATAGEEMAEYVKDFDKPVVVSSASMNASAAYEISSQADFIYTAKTTAIGSIGTALEVTDLSGLLEKLGISIDVIASADSKDSSYGYRPLSEEEQAYYQNMVDAINGTFIANVAEGRGMAEDEVRKLATGLTFTGMEAVENGLADDIGTREDAIAKAAELAGISDYDVYDMGESSYDLSGLLGLLSSEQSQDNHPLNAKEWDLHANTLS
ncbi:signal peptide peptidase SppA [Eggerthellaceae bacterium zg-887]|uniref:signal peptide peptidase SppA n=1 Tax=Xiamenia xianingshaonis TaxID=2682776 RepID=UPI00140BA5CD|nr:signal peptide peptidase SppA [Xiamenia xianingshaonis]NHM15463.1 signal peptide peptidase SppA [Xiamenia xianingshaonis]